MDTVKQLLSEGQLGEAIKQAQQILRQTPADNDLRACLVELLCLAGDIERADEVLSNLAKHHPDWIPGAANLRQLLRAQQARVALREGKLADDVVATAGPALEALLALNLHLCQEEFNEAAEAAKTLEAIREPSEFQVGESAGAIRDCDDSLNGFLEGLGTDGKYYLWQWSEIQALQFYPPTSPVELVWRRVDIELTDGRQGEAFMPLTYTASTTDTQRMGKETDWVEHAPGLVTGVGLKLFLVGDAAVTLDGLQRIERVQTAETSNAV